MTEADIYPLISNIAGGNVFPYVAPSGTAAPWIVFLLPSGTDSDVFCGQAETASTLQIDAWAQSIDEARSLREEIRAALASLNPVSLNEMNDYEPDTSLYRATLEVQLWD
ncbi:DUF3168 domain-containing protein [Candidatus Pantoea alvi]|uniref:DUF3168 domain-containing protein n=1 Tax=Enterobacter agglomerans TaxID=549 RepID=UPI000CDDEC51|nr:DUF3168 domain-containing protein [Pantoea agglomerans]POW57042.1 DUF3168 domain-containing protein [Pantoea alvi]UBN52722.1 DUF3168 domain-containing protein [Pantoea agglomerans]